MLHCTVISSSTATPWRRRCVRSAGPQLTRNLRERAGWFGLRVQLTMSWRIGRRRSSAPRPPVLAPGGDGALAARLDVWRARSTRAVSLAGTRSSAALESIPRSIALFGRAAAVPFLARTQAEPSVVSKQEARCRDRGRALSCAPWFGRTDGAQRDRGHLCVTSGQAKSLQFKSYPVQRRRCGQASLRWAYSPPSRKLNEIQPFAGKIREGLGFWEDCAAH